MASPVRTGRSDRDHPNAHGFRLAREETRHVGGIAREDQRRSERSASAATMASTASDVPALACSSPARRAATSVVGTRASTPLTTRRCARDPGHAGTRLGGEGWGRDEHTPSGVLAIAGLVGRGRPHRGSPGSRRPAGRWRARRRTAPVEPVDPVGPKRPALARHHLEQERQPGVEAGGVRVEVLHQALHQAVRQQAGIPGEQAEEDAVEEVRHGRLRMMAPRLHDPACGGSAPGPRTWRRPAR